jgi:hypothetical protein
MGSHGTAVGRERKVTVRPSPGRDRGATLPRRTPDAELLVDKERAEHAGARTSAATTLGGSRYGE